MRVLIVGAGGQLGGELSAVFSASGAEVLGADREHAEHSVDIRDQASATALLDRLRPDITVNTAAFHQLEECERSPVEAFAVNSAGAMHLARACASAGSRLVHLSSNYVFGASPVVEAGAAGPRPYRETDRPGPLNVLGASKLAGEHLAAAWCPDHVIIRTAALYGMGVSRGRGRNFVDSMLQLAAMRRPAKVIDDIVTTPTWSGALAAQVRLLAEKGEPGLYHATCGGCCSWHDFARAIFEEAGVDAGLTRTKTAAFQAPVRRPAYSALENARAAAQGLDIMPPWRDALRDYLEQRGVRARGA